MELIQLLLGVQIQENELDWACRMHGRNNKYVQNIHITTICLTLSIV